MDQGQGNRHDRANEWAAHRVSAERSSVRRWHVGNKQGGVWGADCRLNDSDKLLNELPMNLKSLKSLFFTACLFVAAFCLAAPPGQMRTNGTLHWSYPTNELSTNLLFKIYSTTNISAPISTWPLYLTVVGTNTQAVFPINAEQRFFSVTASNWHGESPFSNVASTPPPPRHENDLRLGP